MDPLVWLEREIFGNTLLTWSISVGVFFIVWTVLLILRRIVRSRLQALVGETHAGKVALNVIERTKVLFLIIVSVFIAARAVTLETAAQNVLTTVTMIALIVQLGLWVSAGLDKLLGIRREAQIAEDPGSVAAMDIMGFVTRVVVWTIVLLLALDNLGVNITALVAGLGVGGIAVALAAQNILGDLFASLSIVLDKPFVVGDFIIIDDLLGRVEKVGLKTTRVRSLSGEQLIFSNNDLLSSRIRNYGRMFERRVVFSIGVIYSTPVEQLREIPDIIREAVEAQEEARFDRAHFQKHGDFALIFEVVYYVQSPDYAIYMDIQQDINLRIHERFGKDGIEFAYPTQTLYLAREAGADSAAIPGTD